MKRFFVFLQVISKKETKIILTTLILALPPIPETNKLKERKEKAQIKIAKFLLS